MNHTFLGAHLSGDSEQQQSELVYERKLELRVRFMQHSPPR